MEETVRLLTESDDYELSPVEESCSTSIPLSKESETILHDKVSIGDRIREFFTPTQIKWLQRIINVFLEFIPSFLRTPRTEYTLHTTSWLDGLRGVAAFIVYIGHFILFWYPELRNGFASTPNSFYFAQLPMIRIIYSGGPMVTIFFIVSGYALSYSALKKIHGKQFAPLLDTLASAVFRRSLRLNLPIAVSTFSSMIIGRFGGWTSPFGQVPQFPSFWSQLWDWWWNVMCISNPVMSIEGESVYNNHYGFQLWTIPREFRGSLLVYLTLLCVSRAKQLVRTSLMICLASWFLYIAQWDLTLFLAGILLAEMDLICQRNEDMEGEDDDESSPATALWKHVPKLTKSWNNILNHLWTVIFATAGLFVMSFPERNLSSWGYAWMVNLTPLPYHSPNLTHRYWVTIGSLLFVIALCRSPKIGKSSARLLQMPFNTAIAQYLGRISYALYILHGQILFTIGRRIMFQAAGKTTEEYAMWFILAVFVNTICCVWVSDVFWRLVDANAVAFGKFLATKCFVARE